MRLLHILRPTLFGVVALAVLVAAGMVAAQALRPLPLYPTTTHTASSLLSQPIPNSPNAPQLRRGQYLVAAGDCMSCHLREGGEPLAGGLGLKTPFGVIYSPNITSDQATGIGNWTSDQFYRAMHDGVGEHGENLYPAFPYPWFQHASREDDDAMLAYLKTVPAVSYTSPKNELPFPLSMRWVVKGWNLIFLKTDPLTPDSAQSPEWNRGAYLVEGLGHCSGCHTPKSLFGADKTNQALQGGKVDNWVAPDLTGNMRTGLGGWSTGEISEYLKSGRNAHAGAGGVMADVITYSTSLMNDMDRQAIAVYLKSRPASPDHPVTTPDAGAMQRGQAIYTDACTACHLENGVGQPKLFPALGNNAMLQQADATGLEHLILAGSRIGTGPTDPTPLTMPSFAWKLTNRQVADVSTFIRNQWGNQAPDVSATEVADVRKRLDLQAHRLTANSGDQR